VNGPGEAERPTWALLSAERGGVLFERGKIVARHENQKLERVLVERLQQAEEEKRDGV